MSRSLTSTISAVIVARNEEQKITDCINSLLWTREIVVIDNDSNDRTAEVARTSGAKVYGFAGGTFSSRKNFAFSKTSGDWVLFLDADERVTQELRREILEVVNNTSSPYPETSAYAIPRKNFILGKEFLHGGQWPDYVIRLFRRDGFIEWEGRLHEQPKVRGKIGYLKNPIIHLKHNRISEMVNKTNEWSEIESNLMLEAKHPKMNILRFASAIWREFYNRMLLQKSFLDGSEGIIYGLYQVFSRFLSYAKLWEKQVLRERSLK
jgi:glycosyltransferase involved in cell wall biosynthesis